jgi:hypothetical protein
MSNQIMNDSERFTFLKKGKKNYPRGLWDVKDPNC